MPRKKAVKKTVKKKPAKKKAAKRKVAKRKVVKRQQDRIVRFGKKPHDPENPFDIESGQGVRRPEWLKNAQEGAMDDDQFEFLMAIDNYKKANQKPFPTWTEVLFVIKQLGYRKVENLEPVESHG